jgi:hypothetical protein
MAIRFANRRLGQRNLQQDREKTLDPLSKSEGAPGEVGSRQPTSTPEEDARRRRAEELSHFGVADDQSGAAQNQQPAPQKPGIFDVPDLGEGMAAPTGPAQEAMLEAGGDLGDVGSRRPLITAEGDAARRRDAASPVAPAQEEKKGSIFDVDAEGERAAFQQELEANRAKAMQQAEARAGVAGMGLSGATGQLVSDIGRQQQRAGQLAMGEFERQQSAAQFQDIQRQASIWDLEQAENQDIDGDGFRGNPDVGEKPDDPQAGVITDEQKQTLSTLQVDDYSIFDPDTESGTRQEPYSITQQQITALGREGFQLRPVQGGINGRRAFVDQYGNYYIISG